MKFILTIYICSAIAQQCGNPIIIDTKYNNWNDCIKDGYNKSILLLNKFTIDEMNEFQTMTKFTCSIIGEDI
tara:strand:- start:562 stop:777 length:216 start_codon:yes stop_codon:yes gene_type:complete